MVAPIVNPNAPLRTFNKSEVYVGPLGSPAQKWVPNVNDVIVDWDQNQFLRVHEVDYTSGLSVLIPQTMNGGVTNGELSGLVGNEPVSLAESYRLYVNTDTLPHVANIGGRLRTYHPDAAYFKIFRGTGIASGDPVISAIFNGSAVQSENIPLVLVALNNATNLNIRSAADFNITETPIDNEPVSFVAYSASGSPLYATRLLVKITNFVRTLNDSQLYVQAVTLRSSYLSQTDNRLLEIPVNITVDSIDLTARVLFSNGNYQDIGIDGGKVSLLGMDSYAATQPGQTFGLVLSYLLANDEFAINTTAPTPERRITELYRLVTTELAAAYSVKLYVVPVWVNNTWTLRYYMYTLERAYIYDVTPFINYVAGSTFNGTLYGQTQTLNLSVNTQNVGLGYYNHPMSFSITLAGAGNNTGLGSYWVINYDVDSTVGLSRFATVTADPVNAGMRRLNVSCGIATVADWLDAFYYSQDPLRLTDSELLPLAPTHVVVRTNTWQREIPIANVLQNIDQVTDNPSQGSAVRIEFFRRPLNGDDLQLAMVGLTIKTV